MNIIFTVIGTILSVLGVILYPIILKKKNINKQILFSIWILILLGTFFSTIANILSSLKINKMNNFILSSITGGDSFCHVSLGSISPTNDSGYFVVLHKGIYPLFDVQITIVDIDKPDIPKDILTLENVIASQKILRIGNLSPGTAILTDKITFPGKWDLRFNIYIIARNGHTTQYLRLKLVNNKWVGATKVVRGIGKIEKTIFEEINKDYPRNKNGEVDWF